MIKAGHSDGPELCAFRIMHRHDYDAVSGKNFRHGRDPGILSHQNCDFFRPHIAIKQPIDPSLQRGQFLISGLEYVECWNGPFKN